MLATIALIAVAALLGLAGAIGYVRVTTRNDDDYPHEGVDEP